jgi:hypothetical protein
MLGLDHGEWVGAVGQKREVAPVGPEFGLLSEQTGAPDDQALRADHCLGDLRFAVVGIVLKGLPVAVGDRGDCGLGVGLLTHPPIE